MLERVHTGPSVSSSEWRLAVEAVLAKVAGPDAHNIHLQSARHINTFRFDPGFVRHRIDAEGCVIEGLCDFVHAFDLFHLLLVHIHAMRLLEMREGHFVGERKDALIMLPHWEVDILIPEPAQEISMRGFVNIANAFFGESFNILVVAIEYGVLRVIAEPAKRTEGLIKMVLVDT